MSLNLNHLVLAGHLTRNPEVKIIGALAAPGAAQRRVTSFTIAVNRRWKTPEGEVRDEATFVDCEAWGRTAELIGQYLIKGSPIYAEGRLKLDAWQDKDGQKRSRLKVVVETFQFMSGKPRNSEQSDESDPASVPAEVRSGDEAPF